MTDRRIALCVVASLVAHFLASEALSALPERAPTARPRKVEVRVVAPPPAPEPEPAPAPEPPKPVVADPKPQPRIRTPRPATPNAPAPPRPPTTATTQTPSDSAAKPVFGITMESTGGQGPAVPVGNTPSPAAPTGPPPPPSSKPPPAAPAPAHEVTKMPMPRGRCSGVYTDAARAAAIEGVVVLDLVVDEHGRARDITVVERLPHGLTEAAIAAVRTCRFDPGERSGTAVPVRVRGFKIRFVLDN